MVDILGAGSPTSGRDFIASPAISRHISAAGFGLIHIAPIAITARAGSIDRIAFTVFGVTNRLVYLVRQGLIACEFVQHILCHARDVIFIIVVR